MISFSMPCEQKFLHNNLSSIDWTHQKLCAIPAAAVFFEKSSRRQQTHALVVAVRELVVVIFGGFHGCFFFRGSVSVLVPICMFC
jgi:hypothetical protein